MSSSLLRNHYFVHIHLANLPGCFWYSADIAKGILVTTDILHADAVKYMDLTTVRDILRANFDVASIEAFECTNDCLTDAMKRTIRVV